MADDREPPVGKLVAAAEAKSKKPRIDSFSCMTIGWPPAFYGRFSTTSSTTSRRLVLAQLRIIYN